MMMIILIVIIIVVDKVLLVFSLLFFSVHVSSKSYEEERRLRTELEMRSQRLTLELADTKQQIQDGDYRRENYPNIKRCVCLCDIC